MAPHYGGDDDEFDRAGVRGTVRAGSLTRGLGVGEGRYLLIVEYPAMIIVGSCKMIRFRELLKSMIDDPDFLKRSSEPAKEETAEEKTEREELDRLYRFIGLYIVSFQQIEAELDQIILLVVGHEKWHVGQGVVSLLTNVQKIELVQSIVKSSALSSGDQVKQEWLKEFEKLLQEVRNEGVERNKLVYSLYLFDFMAIGAPPLRSNRRKKKGKVDFQRDSIDANYMREALARISELSFDVGMCRTQLIHWSDIVQKTSH